MATTLEFATNFDGNLSAADVLRVDAKLRIVEAVFPQDVRPEIFFGIELEFNLGGLRPDENRLTALRYITGEIVYPNGDRGKILLLKTLFLIVV